MALFPGSGEVTSLGLSSLDQILKNTEFENSQHIKAIETERERIEAYEKETEEKQREVKSLDESTMGFDEEAKNLHKQLVLQRENLESLKHTSGVLDEHEDALKRKLKAALLDMETEGVEQKRAMQKHEGVWEGYRSQYESTGRFQGLWRATEELQMSSDHSAGLEKEVRELEESIAKLQVTNSQSEALPWILQIAQLHVSKDSELRVVQSNWQRLELMQQELGRLREQISALEEQKQQRQLKSTSNSQGSDRLESALGNAEVLPSQRRSSEGQENGGHFSSQIMVTVPTIPTVNNSSQLPSYPQVTIPTSAPPTIPSPTLDYHNPRSARQPNFVFPEIPTRPQHSSSGSFSDLAMSTAPSSSPPPSPNEAFPNTSPNVSKYMLHFPLQPRSPASHQYRSAGAAFTNGTPWRPPSIAETVHLPAGGSSNGSGSTGSQQSHRVIRQIPLLQTPTRPSATHTTTAAVNNQLTPRSSPQLAVPSPSIPRPPSAVVQPPSIPTPPPALTQPPKRPRTADGQPARATQDQTGQLSKSDRSTARDGSVGHSAAAQKDAGLLPAPGPHTSNIMQGPTESYGSQGAMEEGLGEPLMTSTLSDQAEEMQERDGFQDQGQGEMNVSFGTLLDQHGLTTTSSPVFNFGWFDGGTEAEQQSGFSGLVDAEAGATNLNSGQSHGLAESGNGHSSSEGMFFTDVSNSSLGGDFGFTFAPFTGETSSGSNSPAMNFSIFGESSPSHSEQNQGEGDTGFAFSFGSSASTTGGFSLF